MQFKHPEILYFLFVLVIPILVHLFQLRRFKKEYFTNVQFLKELSIQTRKSSKIKKWLLLITRLLLLTALIIAFSQPFFKAKDSKNISNEMRPCTNSNHAQKPVRTMTFTSPGMTHYVRSPNAYKCYSASPKEQEVSPLTWGVGS